MRLSEIMHTKVKTAQESEAAETAYQRMRLAKVRHLVVVDVTGGVVGVLSDRDLGGERGVELRRNRSVGDLMSRPVVTAAPETTLRQAANQLRGHTIGCVPVLDDGRLVGIITTTDLLLLIGRGAERPVARTKRWTLAHRSQGRYRAQVR